MSNTRCDYRQMVVIVAPRGPRNWTLRASVRLDARPAKAEPEPTAFSATTDSARPGTEGGEYFAEASLGRPKSRGEFGC